MNIKVFVQTCPQRRETRRFALESIEQSDIGKDYTLVEHTDGMQPGDGTGRAKARVLKFFGDLLQQMYESGVDYCLRLEDDVIVNRHILHNIRTWPALSEKNFGVGWLFVPPGVIEDEVNRGKGPRTGTHFRNNRGMFGALAVLFPRDRIPLISPKHLRLGQDIAISAAMWDHGWRCYLHEPSLVENNLRIPSARAHTNSPDFHAVGPDFKRKWRR